MTLTEDGFEELRGQWGGHLRIPGKTIYFVVDCLPRCARCAVPSLGAFIAR